eukprot:c25323_g1_i6 orf=919-2988(+)
MASATSLQMNWLPLQTRKGSPLGLKNLGNSCYLNSVLQCLTYTPPLANLCLLNHHSSSCTFMNGSSNSVCPFCLVEKRIARSLSVDSVSESPARIHGCLTLFAKHFRQGWQEDAHEFLRYVIEACNSVCVKLHKLLSASKLRTRQDSQKVSKEEPRTVVKDIFGGVLQSQVKCLSCDAESNKLDDIMDLSLDVVKISSVKDAMCRFFQSEVLDGSNKYRCEKCRKLTAARKQMSVFHAPNVLVIQLKRFENIYGGKIDRHISFEERMEIHSHMCRENQDQRPEYLLYAVIVHAGYSQDSGHYYSYVKDVNGKWFCCNDAHVTSVSTKSVLSEKVYVLFYVRHTTKAAVKGFESSQNGNSTNTLSDKSEGVQEVRFNIRKPVSNGQARKHVSGDNGRAGKSSIDSGQAKTPVGSSRVVSNRSVECSGVLKNDPAELQKGEHEEQNHCASVQKLTANGNSHSKSVVNGVEKLGEKSESNGHNFRVSSSRNTDGVEPVSNGHAGSQCVAKVSSSCNGVSQSQQAISQPLQERVAACSFTDRCEKANLTEGKLPNGGVKRKLPNGSLENHNLKENGHSQDTAGEGVANQQTSSESLLVEVSDLQSLKLWLATDSREWLLRSGWCDTVRNSFRQLKKARLTQDSQSIDVKREILRSDSFASVHDSLRQKVPKELKEHLVEQLHVHFAARKLKER